MLSWEYPPLVVGGIAAHVDGLSRAMAAAGHDVVVFSLRHPSTGGDTVVDGVRVLRAATDLPWIPSDNLVATMASANHQIVQLTTQLGDWRPDVVHAHDWLVAWAGDTLHTLYGVPLVATIHATERGRQGGQIPAGMPAAINAVEWWLTYQAREVIACSDYMVREVTDSFELPPDKIHLVPNGVEAETWRPRGVRDPNPDAPLVVAWGRVQYEKGFQVLAQAIGALRASIPGIHCIIAGRGSFLADLQARIESEGLNGTVTLAGFVPHDDLLSLLRRASCVVIPSLYEPFGIVALEGMASGVPCVIARTGGLAEIVGDTGAALLFEPGNPADCARQITTAISDARAAESMCSVAAHLLEERYTWSAIAATTVRVYERAVEGDRRRRGEHDGSSTALSDAHTASSP